VLSVALDNGSVAFASRVNADDTGEIKLRTPADTAATLVATTSSLNSAFLTLVALSGNKLAWSDGAGGGTVMVRNGATTTALATGQGAIFAIAIDATDIYWLHGAGNAVKLERATWAGGRTTLLTGQLFSRALVLEAGYLYYSQVSSVYRLHR
jgi:hypothetical protein